MEMAAMAASMSSVLDTRSVVANDERVMSGVRRLAADDSAGVRSAIGRCDTACSGNARIQAPVSVGESRAAAR